MTLSETVEQIEVLFKEATRGPWESDASRMILGPCFTGELKAIADKVRGGNSYEANANAQLIVALVNAWPAIREALSRQSAPQGWQPIDDAARKAEPKEILLRVEDRYGNRKTVVAHWAFGGGDEQPRFGPAWFYSCGDGFAEIPSTWKLHAWQPIPVGPGMPVANSQDSHGIQVCGQPQAFMLADQV